MSDTTIQQLPAVMAAVKAKLPDIQDILPPGVPIKAFFGQFKLAVLRDATILQCTQKSVVQVCMQAAADGLLLDGREAAVVIHNNKQRDGTWRKEAIYWQMYQGQLKRVRMAEGVARIEARIVHHKDKFAITYGDEPTISHTPAFGRDRGEIIGCYAIVTMKDGIRQHEWMEIEEVEAIRNRSRGYNPEKPGGPWHTDFAEMAKKTVLRRLAKLLPQASGHAADAVDADDIESAADDIDMLDFERQEPPRQVKAPEEPKTIEGAPETPAEQPTSRIPAGIEEPWSSRLENLERDVRLGLDRGAVEEAWQLFDEAWGDSSPPQPVLAAVKDIVDTRLAQISR